MWMILTDKPKARAFRGPSGSVEAANPSARTRIPPFLLRHRRTATA